MQELADKEGIKLFPISAATRQGLKELIACVSQAIDDYVEEPEEESGEVVYDVQEEDPDKVTITKDYTGVYVVSGKSLNKLVAMTNFGNDEAVRRFQYIWRIKGIDGKLRQRGIKEGDTVRIGEMEFEYRD